MRLVVVERGECGLGRGRDRRTNTARRAVSRDGDRATFAPEPGFAKRMAEQRQRPRRVAELGHDEFGEAFLDDEPAPLCRLLHGAHEIGRAQRSEQHLARRQPLRELLERTELAVEVGAQRHDESTVVRVHRVDERVLLLGVSTDGDQFLELIDDQHRVRVCREACLRERVHRMRARPHRDRLR